MKTDRIKITPGEPPEDYVSIPCFFGKDASARLLAHIEAVKLEDRMEKARDVTPKENG